VTRAPAVLLVTTMLVGAVVVGFAAGRLGREADRPDEPSVLGTGELATLTRAPVDVRAERVVLRAGFVSRHRHGGPTFNFVDAGVVVIESAGEQRRYDADGFFFEPGGRVHSITVLEDAQLRVVRLLPPGSEPTTEVP
jgi:hypothetical protein